MKSRYLSSLVVIALILGVVAVACWLPFPLIEVHQVLLPAEPEASPVASIRPGEITEADALAIAKKRVAGGRAQYDYSVRRDGPNWNVWVTPYTLDKQGRHLVADDSDTIVEIDPRGKVLSERPAL